ncbi:MAG: hemin uptake protein HemP, partial [Planctomycetota bacterium]
PKPEPRELPSASATHRDARGFPVYSFDKMATDSPAVLVELNGTVYELRKTRNGKLILSR